MLFEQLPEDKQQTLQIDIRVVMKRSIAKESVNGILDDPDPTSGESLMNQIAELVLSSDWYDQNGYWTESVIKQAIGETIGSRLGVRT